MKNNATIKSIYEEDQVTTTSTSHKYSSHLAPSQVHLPSPVSPKLQSKSSVDLLSLISQAPLIRTRSPERALMDADYNNVCLNDQDGAVDCNNNNECIFCSKLSHSIPSRGCTDLQVSQCDFVTCQNCLSKFCTSCLQELIQSVDGFPTIPRTVKSSDPTYRQLIEIGTQISLGSRTVISGPCCSFKPQEALLTFIKTPQPDPTSQCSCIASIKSHRSSSSRIKVNNLQPLSSDVLKLQ